MLDEANEQRACKHWQLLLYALSELSKINDTFRIVNSGHPGATFRPGDLKLI